MANFNRKKALSFAWETYKSNLGFILLVFITPFLISFTTDIIEKTAITDIAVIAVIFGIGTWLLNMLVQIGLLRIALNFVDKKKSEYKDIFLGGDRLLDFILTTLLYGLIIVAGLILLVVPGIIWAIKYQFCTYLVVDKKLSPVEALKRSGEMTKGVRWPLLGLVIIFFLINLAGVLAFGVGIIVTIPVTALAYAHVYRQLNKTKTREKSK